MTDRNSRQRSNDHLSFAVLPDETGGYQTHEESNRGPMVLALALGLIAVFGVVVWNAYKQGVRNSDQSVLPQIASEGAFKTRPIEPGGLASVNKNMQVLDQIDGEIRKEKDFSQAKVREEPVPVLETVAIDSNATNALSSKQIPSSVQLPKVTHVEKQIGQSGKPLDLRPGAVSAERPIQTAEIATPAPIKKIPSQSSADINITPIQKPKPRSEETDSTPQTKNFSVNGSFVIQLAAVKTNDDVDKVWVSAGNKAPKLFENAKRYVQTVDLGAKGVWHRVQAGSFDSRAEANVFCSAYKASGGDCIVAERK